MNIAIQYDLNGNRARISTGLSVLSAAGAGTETPRDSVRQFEYDAMNRQKVVDEYDETRGVVRHQIDYDLNGNRTSDHYWGKQRRTRVGAKESITTFYGESGEVSYSATTPITYERRGRPD